MNSMKQYKITKVIYAKDFKTAIKNEPNATIVEIVLNEELSKPNGSIGFSK